EQLQAADIADLGGLDRGKHVVAREKPLDAIESSQVLGMDVGPFVPAGAVGIEKRGHTPSDSRQRQADKPSKRSGGDGPPSRGRQTNRRSAAGLDRAAKVDLAIWMGRRHREDLGAGGATRS